MDADRLDVDARFLLADERTLLAWVRAALTLLAAGFAVQELASSRGSTAPAGGAPYARVVVVSLLGVLALVIALLPD